MRKFLQLFFVLCMLISVSAKGQFSKGDRLIGGSVNVYSGNGGSTFANGQQYTSNYYSSGLVPRYSWVLKNNIMNGIFLNANYSHSANNYSSGPPDGYQKIDNYSFGVGYFIRKYKDFDQQFGWFLEYNALLGYNSYRQESAYPSGNFSINKSSSVSAGLNALPGLYYKVSRAAVIEAGFGGINANYSNGISGDSRSHSFNVGLNFPSNFTFG